MKRLQVTETRSVVYDTALFTSSDLMNTSNITKVESMRGDDLAERTVLAS